MSSERRQYSPQFKLQVVLELLKGEKSAAQIAREHGIGHDLLFRSHPHLPGANGQRRELGWRHLRVTKHVARCLKLFRLPFLVLAGM